VLVKSVEIIVDADECIRGDMAIQTSFISLQLLVGFAQTGKRLCNRDVLYYC